MSDLIKLEPRRYAGSVSRSLKPVKRSVRAVYATDFGIVVAPVPFGVVDVLRCLQECGYVYETTKTEHGNTYAVVTHRKKA